jgi:acetyl esterase/lipase
MTALILAITLAASSPVIELWPEGVPGLHKDATPEKEADGRFTNIHHPTLTVFAPTNANGTAMIYCAGGGYVRVAMGQGGGSITRWLNSLGVTVFALKYRNLEYGQPAPLQDLLQAMRVVRSCAGTNHVGIIGASAGGHLAACAATMFTNSVERPDFVALIYPVITMEDPFVHKGSRTALLGEKPPPELIEQWSVEKHVRTNTPPVFLVATEADKSVPVENTLMFYQALRKAGVPAEMHVYAQGSHGNSLDPRYGPTADWPKRCEEWLRFNGALGSAARSSPAASADSSVANR